MLIPVLSSQARRVSYEQKVKTLCGSNLIAYWRLNDLNSTALDSSGNGYNGSHTGTTQGQPGIGDGLTSQYYDGANDYTDIYSAGFAGAFDGDEGTLAGWAKVDSASVWADGTVRYVARLYSAGTNQIFIYKNSTNNSIIFQRSAGAQSEVVTATGITSVVWMALAITWSKAADEFKAFINGVQTGSTETGLDNWTGALSASATTIGAGSTTPASVWHGYLQHCIVCDAALPAATIAQLAKV